ncbi:hypothetical protein SAMN04489759_1214 [Sulfitobacter delicatus]|jgi:uncharacterized membrane protein YuzA (DUF378 family)|uniref:Uncharacterized protein n=1 Tax=Sulfitobacter delicatus TaxID=218672 RepID=A0A1G7ZD38_9RHOB|nr:hypothetical protein SAMN04489759_1214 [Sulfitobacter delicatus]
MLMLNPFRSLLELRGRFIASRKKRESWEERVVDPILASGHDQLLTEVYRHRSRAALLSLLIGIFPLVALVAYVVWDLSLLTDRTFYTIVALCAFGTFWTVRETVYHARQHTAKLELWLEGNQTFL